jgi:hypothetical protein
MRPRCSVIRRTISFYTRTNLIASSEPRLISPNDRSSSCVAPQTYSSRFSGFGILFIATGDQPVARPLLTERQHNTEDRIRKHYPRVRAAEDGRRRRGCCDRP